MNVIEVILNSFTALGSAGEIPGEIKMRIIRGPLFEFWVDARPGLTGWELEKLLRLYGIRLCARFVDPRTGEIRFKVARSQASWAEYVMRRWRIPLCGPVVNHRNDKASAHPFPLKPWGTGLPVNNFVGVLCAVLDTLFGMKGLQVAGSAPAARSGLLGRIIRAVDVVLDAVALFIAGDSIRKAWEAS